MELRGQAHVAPHIGIVFCNKRATQEARSRVCPKASGRFRAQPALNLGILLAHAIHLVGRIDRRAFVILPVCEHGVVHVHHAFRAGIRLERERRVLERRAGRGQEANAVLGEERTPVDGRPDRGLLPEDKRILTRAHRNTAALRARDLEELTTLLWSRPVQVEIALGNHGVRILGGSNKHLERTGIHDVVRLQDGDVGTARSIEPSVHRIPVT